MQAPSYNGKRSLESPAELVAGVDASDEAQMSVFNSRACFECAVHYPESEHTCPSCSAPKTTNKKLKSSGALGATDSDGATDLDAPVSGGENSGGSYPGGANSGGAAGAAREGADTGPPLVMVQLPNQGGVCCDTPGRQQRHHSRYSWFSCR